MSQGRKFLSRTTLKSPMEGFGPKQKTPSQKVKGFLNSVVRITLVY